MRYSDAQTQTHCFPELGGLRAKSVLLEPPRAEVGVKRYVCRKAQTVVNALELLRPIGPRRWGFHSGLVPASFGGASLH